MWSDGCGGAIPGRELRGRGRRSRRQRGRSAPRSPGRASVGGSPSGDGSGAGDWGRARSSGASTAASGHGLEAAHPEPRALTHTSKGLATVIISPKKNTPTPPITARAAAPKCVGRTSIPEGHRPGEPGEDQAPEDDRAFQGGPGGGDVEGERGRGCVVVGDVGDAEIVGEQTGLHGHHRGHRPAQHQPRRCDQVPGSRLWPPRPRER